jgi:hypothetical protein
MVIASLLADNKKSIIHHTLDFSFPTSTDTPPHTPTATEINLTPITGFPCYCLIGSCPFHNKKQDLFPDTSTGLQQVQSHGVHLHHPSSAPSLLQLCLQSGGTNVVTPALPSISTNPILTPNEHNALPAILSKHLPHHPSPPQHHHHKPVYSHPSTSYVPNTTSKTSTTSSSTRFLPPPRPYLQQYKCGTHQTQFRTIHLPRYLTQQMNPDHTTPFFCPIEGCTHSSSIGDNPFPTKTTLLCHLNTLKHCPTHHFTNYASCATSVIFHCCSTSCPSSPTTFFTSL